MGRVGGGELYVILLAVLLVFGPSKISDTGRSLVGMLRKFRGASPEAQSPARTQSSGRG